MLKPRPVVYFLASTQPSHQTVDDEDKAAKYLALQNRWVCVDYLHDRLIHSHRNVGICQRYGDVGQAPHALVVRTNLLPHSYS